MSNKLVQCFYNVTYNEGSYAGQSKCCYGFLWLDLLSEDQLRLDNQIQNHLVDNGLVDKDTKFYNFHVTSLTPFHAEVFEEVTGKAEKLPLWSDDKDIDDIMDKVEEGEYSSFDIQSILYNLTEDIQCLKEDLSEKS